MIPPLTTRGGEHILSPTILACNLPELESYAETIPRRPLQVSKELKRTIAHD